MANDFKHIITRRELQELAKELGVRKDWHEPDEQGLTAITFGKNFDNAGHWGLRHLADRQLNNQMRLWNPADGGEPVIEDAERFCEIFVVLYCEDKAVAEIDLATLFAFACGTYAG